MYHNYIVYVINGFIQMTKEGLRARGMATISEADNDGRLGRRRSSSLVGGIVESGGV